MTQERATMRGSERVLFVLWSCPSVFYFLLDFLISGNVLFECDASFTSVAMEGSRVQTGGGICIALFFLSLLCIAFLTTLISLSKQLLIDKQHSHNN